MNHKQNKLSNLFYPNSCIIVNYHYFSESVSGLFQCTKSGLDFQLSYLRKYYSVLPLKEVLAILELNKSLPPKSIVITVDDCDESFYRTGWPLLKQYKVPIHCSVITGSIGAYCDAIGRKVVSRQQLDELVSSGLVTLGSHSMTHSHLHELTSKELIKEIVDSREVIKSIQGNCEVFAYPYGGSFFINEHVETLMDQAGYDYALTTTGGFIKRGTDRFRIGRMNLSGNLNHVKYNRLITAMIKLKKFIKREKYYSKVSPRGVIGSGKQ